MIIIEYIDKEISTGSILRQVINLDLLRTHADLMWAAMEAMPEHKDVWLSPTKLMPKKTYVQGKEYALQTPREYMQGFIDKINRRIGNDLSERQCWGFENFALWFSQEFNTPEIKFLHKLG